MDKPLGGRGLKAPYETKQMRVPVKLEPQIHELIDRFRDWIADSCPSGIGLSELPKLLDKAVDKLQYERDSLEQKVNQLHTRNGALNLEIAELKEQLKAVNKLTENGTSMTLKPVDKLVCKVKAEVQRLHPMKQRKLAGRLGLKSHTSLTTKKWALDFTEWSEERDPDRIGWRFDQESELFYPVN